MLQSRLPRWPDRDELDRPIRWDFSTPVPTGWQRFTNWLRRLFRHG